MADTDSGSERRQQQQRIRRVGSKAGTGICLRACYGGSSLAHSFSCEHTLESPFQRRASSRRFRSSDSVCARTVCGVCTYVCMMEVFLLGSVCAVRARRSHARFPGDDTPSRSHNVVGHDERSRGDIRDAPHRDDR